MANRWMRLRRLVDERVTAQDALGLRSATLNSIGMGGDPISRFREWLDEAARQVVLGGDGLWVGPYVDEAVARARARAHRLLGDAGTEEHPLNLQVLRTHAATELRGVVSAVKQQVSRIAADAVLKREQPARVSAAMADRIRKVGQTRGAALAETVVVMAFTRATLDTFRSLGVTRVGVDAERRTRQRIRTTAHGKVMSSDALKPGEYEVITAGDDDVCPVCEDISLGGPYDLDEAQGLIPAHNRCRCAFVPAEDERFSKVEHDE